METLTNMTTRQISAHTLNIARRELDALISTRDWYVADTHHPFLPVALWRTVKRNRAIININNMIDSQRDVVERLEDELNITVEYTVPAPRLSTAAQAVLDAMLTGQALITGEIDGAVITSTQHKSFVRISAAVDGVTVYENDSRADDTIDQHALCQAAHGLQVNLTAHSLKTDTHSDVRLKGDGHVTNVTVNNWEVARLPAHPVANFPHTQRRVLSWGGC
jgi:hypothetical protein